MLDRATVQALSIVEAAIFFVSLSYVCILGTVVSHLKLSCFLFLFKDYVIGLESNLLK